MLWQTLHHIAVLYHHGHYDAAARLLRHLLHHYHGHPGVLALIHRVAYAINPDWGL